MMIDVVVAPSLGGLLVGCMVLLTRSVPVVVIALTIWGGEVVPSVWRGVVVPKVWGEVVAGGGVVSSEVDAVETKHITWHYSTIHKNVTFLKYVHENSSGYPQQMETGYKCSQMVHIWS